MFLRLLLISLVFCSLVFSQNLVTVKGVGFGKTESMALEDARRNAVLEALEILYEDNVQQKEIIKGKVTDRPTAYIKNESVIKSEFDEDVEKFKVVISADISRSLIQQDLQGIDKTLERANRPKVLVLSTYYFSEKILPRYTGIAVNTINEVLGKLGFTYVSQDAVFNIMQQMGNYSGAQSFQDIAMKSNTTYYISVDIKMDEKGLGSNNAWNSNVNIQLEAFDTENATGVGTVVESSGNVGSVVNQNEASLLAIKEVSEKAAHKIAEQILMNLERNLSTGFDYEIRIFGIDDYMVAREFKDALTKYEGFTGSIRMSKMDDHYRFEMKYKSSRPDEFIDSVFDALTGKTLFRRLNLRSSTGKLINFDYK